jgi:glycerophosphoryl diester phosphodiesterase
MENRRFFQNAHCCNQFQTSFRVDHDDAVIADSHSPHLRPLLLGHRGARRGAPENTFFAFDKALREGCDGFEFDVRLSSDGRAVISHDPTLHGLEIAQSNFSELLAVRQAQSNPRSSHDRSGHDRSSHDRSGHDISSQGTPQLHCLEDVLAKYAESAFLDIELKTGGLEEATLQLLARFPAKRGAVVSSFLPEVLRRLAGLCAESPARAAGGAVGDGSSAHPLGRTTSQKSSRVAGVGAEKPPLGLIFDNREAMRQWELLPVSHLMPRHDLVDRRLVHEFHAAGKQVFAWTVNRERQMHSLAEMGVDGLISDDPELLSRFRERFSP